EWNQRLLEIRDELAFIRKLRGGRLSNIKYNVTHPKEIFTRSRTSFSHPSTPNNGAAEPEGSPAPMPSSRRGTRSRSNSALGPAAVMAGVVAGSVVRCFPIEKDAGDAGDAGSLKSSRSMNKDELEAQQGIEVHPQIKPSDPILALDAHDQNTETTPNFTIGPFAGELKLNDGKKDDTKPIKTCSFTGLQLYTNESTQIDK
ncbi:hypothetical protein E8E12_000063, partial [Didymella heteroderae]